MEKDRYVVIDDEEVKAIAPASSDTMEILEFVKAEGIDPIYFDSSYFMVPEEAGKKAYQLLLETMKKSGYSAGCQDHDASARVHHRCAAQYSWPLTAYDVLSGRGSGGSGIWAR